MSQILQIKKRLKSIQNIYKVTRAMETMAITGLRRIQKQYKNSSEYLKRLTEVFAQLCAETECGPEKKQRPRSYFILFSLRGFCGNFNNNLLNYFNGSYPYLQQKTDQVFLVGQMAQRFARRLIKTNLQIIAYDDLVKVCQAEIKADHEIQLIYNRYLSILKQDPQIYKLYPFNPPEQKTLPEIYFEPDKKTLLENFIPLYLQAVLEGKQIETLLGEYCNRFHSMKSANDNAQLLVEELQITLNKTRQSTITAELSEVVSAFEVMKRR